MISFYRDFFKDTPFTTGPLQGDRFDVNGGDFTVIDNFRNAKPAAVHLFHKGEVHAIYFKSQWSPNEIGELLVQEIAEVLAMEQGPTEWCASCEHRFPADVMTKDGFCSVCDEQRVQEQSEEDTK